MKCFNDSYLNAFSSADYHVDQFNRESYQAVQEAKHSILVICGPVGYGKSHLLAAALKNADNIVVESGDHELSAADVPDCSTAILENADSNLSRGPEVFARFLDKLLKKDCRVIVTCASSVNLEFLPPHRLCRLGKPSRRELSEITYKMKLQLELSSDIQLPNLETKSPREIATELYKLSLREAT